MYVLYLFDKIIVEKYNLYNICEMTYYFYKHFIYIQYYMKVYTENINNSSYFFFR